MHITKDKMVSLTYTLREGSEQGRVLETVEKGNPLTFLFGNGKLLSKFEENISDLPKGEGFAFQLTPEDAYGQRREELIVDIPKTVFEMDGQVDEQICRIGNQVPMMDKSGRRLNGIILDIYNSTVKMDFNHPMAGVNLHFAGNVEEVREATAAELAQEQQSDCSCCSDADGCSGESCT